MKGCLVLFRGGSTLSNKGGGHPDPEIRGRAGLIFFRPFAPQFGLKIRGARAPRAPPLDAPLLFTNIYEISTVLR